MANPDDQNTQNDQASVPEILLDKVDALKVLRASSNEERDALLLQIGGRGQVEKEMVVQLSAIKPLHYPDRFEEAHHMMMRSLEVLERNGSRAAKMPRLGPLTPIAKWLVEQVSGLIVRSYLSKVLNRICGLYERREANADWSTPEHSMLRRARLDARRVKDGMNTRSLGLPTFILGGAVLSSVAGGLQSLARTAFDSTVGVLVLGGAVTLLLGALSWVALFSAGVARRRIRLATDQPLAALWETIGAAGKPPHDDSYNFATYAIILLVLSWIVVPLAIWLAVVA